MNSRRRKTRVPESVTVPSPWRRGLPGLIFAAVLLTAVVCSRTARTPVRGDDFTRYHDQSFVVVRVIDGDTFDIDIPDGDKKATRVRLWGVDTPEVSHGGGTDMHFGPEASAFAKKTLEHRGVHIVLSPKRTRGKYGRLLAYVYLERGGRMFNEMLLEEGYAYADLRFGHHYYDQFKRIEKRARKAGVGLWADVTLDKMPPWKQRFEQRASRGGD
ncbi:MAG: thermonuclease family protein [Phycisphaerae bacterium]|jgi:micrococcal nuclease